MDRMEATACAALSQDGSGLVGKSGNDWEAKWRRGPAPRLQFESMALGKDPQRLDALPAGLELQLLPVRQRLGAWVDEQLRLYDESPEYPRPEDWQFECRDRYEMHVRGEASKEVQELVTRVADKLAAEAWQRAHASRHLDEVHEETRPREKPTVLIALMAVHIATEGRLKKLSQALRSIQEQQMSGSGAELHVAVSWYAPMPALAARVQQAFHAFIDARMPRDAQQLPAGRAAGRGSFLRFAGSQASPAAHEAGGARVTSAPCTVVIRQTERRTQFQHYRAALSAVESQLRQRWGLRPGAEDTRSVWAIFGDDDDLWHRRRAAEFARAIRAHPQVDAVAAFATLTRAGIGLFEGQTLVPEAKVPSRADQVDEFLRQDQAKVYVGANHADEEPCKKWQKKLEIEGKTSTDRPLPEELCMEHFDFCPRLRVLQEFFDTTSEEVIGHRFCDLRLCEFLETYPRMGKEFGLELSFFQPNCWMYFYRNAGVGFDEFQRSLEEPDDQVHNLRPDVMFAQKEHVSAEVPLQQEEICLADRVCSEFSKYDARVTQPRLARYFAAFRLMMEHYLVRLHTRKVDQRRFDGLVVQNAVGSFGSFAEKVTHESPDLASGPSRMLLRVCRDFAETLASGLGVQVLWHKPTTVLVPKQVAIQQCAGQEAGAGAPCHPAAACTVRSGGHWQPRPPGGLHPWPPASHLAGHGAPCLWRDPPGYPCANPWHPATRILAAQEEETWVFYKYQVPGTPRL